jgi:hypothetical protein
MKGLTFFRNWETEDLILIGLMIIGFILRIYNLGEFSITNDEMTALVQTNVPDLTALYETNKIGVHPFGYYFFLFYWIKIFGNNPFALRLPFMLFGMGSILLSYLLANKWFNKVTALFTATCMALLTFPVLYSQLARPYSPGLFFSLLAIWYWTKLVFPIDRKEITWGTYAGFILTAWAAALMHYFALMLVGLAGLTGMLFIDRRQWKYYILSGIIVLVMYVPFAPILINQMGRSGLDWLGRPYPNFLLNFVIYIFNKDYLLLYFFVLIMGILGWQSRKRINWSPFHTICLIFFMVPFVVAYIKSVTGKPILQERALIFEMPFLIMFLCSFYVPQGRAAKRLVKWAPPWAAFFLLCLYSFFFRVHFYKDGLGEFGNFKEISAKAVEYYQQYKGKLTLAANVNRPFYVHYYPQKQGVTLPYKMYRCDDNIGLDSLQMVVNQANTPYFFYCWSHIFNPAASSHIIRSQYPVIVHNEQHGLHGYALYHKAELVGDTMFHMYNSFDSVPAAGWNNIKFSREHAASGSISAKVHAADEYSAGYTTSLGRLNARKGDKLLISAKVMAMALPSAAVLVMETAGKQKMWVGSVIGDYVTDAAQWRNVYLMADLQDFDPQDVMKIYLYNPAGEMLYVDDMDILIVRER